MGTDQKPKPNDNADAPSGDAVKDQTGAAPAAPKPDPARYGDWTVNGIAVDF
jgi:hypothetical protein